MPNSDKSITRIFFDLERIEEQYRAETRTYPFNISHWDADASYHKTVAKLIRLQVEGNRFEYEFSHTLPSQLVLAVANQLGLTANRFTQITPSGTSANLLVLVLLARLGKRRLIIVGPCYFHVPPIAKSLGFDVIFSDAWYPNNGLLAEGVQLKNCETDVVWVTNPAYCFGMNYSVADINVFNCILSSGFTLVADECNSQNGNELGRILSKFENFIGTYSPHKGICVNGLKFGVLNTSLKFESALREIGDAWVGPLPRSIRTDMNHFISENFLSIQKIFNASVEESEDLIILLAKRLPVKMHPGHGHFRVISINGISNEFENSLDLFKAVLVDSETTFIPMACNYGPKEFGFSFRVNMLLSTSILIERIPRVVNAVLRNGI